MMRPLMKDRRWQLAWWGAHLIGAGLFLACVWSAGWPWWWIAVTWACSYTTGFVAAVLVEIATA